jgi:invasion protein IalB
MAPAHSDREPPLTRTGAAAGALDADIEVEGDEQEGFDEPAPRRRRGGIGRILLPVLAVVVILACAGVGYYLATNMSPAGTAGGVTPDASSPSAAGEPARQPIAADAAKSPGAQQPAAQPPAAAAQLTTERFESWFVVCPANAPTSLDCFMQQQLRSSKSDALVFVWALRRDEKGTIHAVWQTPPGLDTARGMVLDAGDGTPRPVPISSCDAKSCLVRGVLAPAYLSTLAAASRVTATIVMQSDGRALRYGFEPKGMAAALARLQQAGS